MSLTVTAHGDREILITRVFDAPREHVFAALTQPTLLLRWFHGPPGWTLTVCEIDLKVGGAYRYVWRKDNGYEMGMGGIFLEIVPPERIVQTEVFDHPWYPGQAIGTQLLTEHRGRTTLTIAMRYDSPEIRDGVLRSPMEQGLAYGYDRLAELLATLDKTETAR